MKSKKDDLKNCNKRENTLIQVLQIFDWNIISLIIKYITNKKKDESLLKNEACANMAY